MIKQKQNYKKFIEIPTAVDFGKFHQQIMLRKKTKNNNKNLICAGFELMSSVIRIKRSTPVPPAVYYLTFVPNAINII